MALLTYEEAPDINRDSEAGVAADAGWALERWAKRLADGTMAVGLGQPI
jgi:hypothetical protein